MHQLCIAIIALILTALYATTAVNVPHIPGLDLSPSTTQQQTSIVDTIPGLGFIPQADMMAPPGATEVYLLAMERPKPQGLLSLHGLWPQDGMSCPGEAFDAAKLAPIRSEMDTWWYSYKEKSAKANEAFWKHEWYVFFIICCLL